ncbi:hypothetical protein ACFL59_09345 [Planctomycetota bacterium]
MRRRKKGKEHLSVGGKQWRTWQEYRKHFPLPNRSREEIIAATANREPSRYFPGIDIEGLEMMAAREGVEVPSGSPTTLYKVYEHESEIGASDGKVSRWVRVESSSGVVHGHPITSERYEGYLRSRENNVQ